MVDPEEHPTDPAPAPDPITTALEGIRADMADIKRQVRDMSKVVADMVTEFQALRRDMHTTDSEVKHLRSVTPATMLAVRP